MEIFGIKFAPLNVPIQRRLQTLAAGAIMVTILFGAPIGIWLLVNLLFSSYWPIAVAYIIWTYVIDKDSCERGGRRIKWVRGWTWFRYVKEYFPIRMKRLPSVQLDPKRNYIFCYFPHGVLPLGLFTSIGTTHGDFYKLFPHHTPYGVALRLMFYIPVVRKSGQHRIVLKNRKGFVKLALKQGTPLVPVFAFGETDIYGQLDSPLLRNIQQYIKRVTGVAPIILLGRGLFQYSFGIIPFRKPVTCIVGEPIEVLKTVNPTQEQIDVLHQLFMEKLTELFEEQKYNYVSKPQETSLVID